MRAGGCGNDKRRMDVAMMREGRGCGNGERIGM